MVLGFQFRQEPDRASVWISVPVILGIAILALWSLPSRFTPAQTVVVEGVELVQAIAIFSTGLVPLNSYRDSAVRRPSAGEPPSRRAHFAMGGRSLSIDQDAVDRGYLRRMRRTLGVATDGPAHRYTAGPGCQVGSVGNVSGSVIESCLRVLRGFYFHDIQRAVLSMSCALSDAFDALWEPAVLLQPP